MCKRNIKLLIEDMIISANKIIQYTNKLDFDGFIDDDKTIDAVIRNFEIIGEAANRISPEFRNKYPKVEWQRMRGFRNRIVHEYFGIDYEIVWSIIEYYLTDLISELKTVIFNIEIENKADINK